MTTTYRSNCETCTERLTCKSPCTWLKKQLPPMTQGKIWGSGEDIQLPKWHAIAGDPTSAVIEMNRDGKSLDQISTQVPFFSWNHIKTIIKKAEGE